jgi:hypothetical protein
MSFGNISTPKTRKKSTFMASLPSNPQKPLGNNKGTIGKPLGIDKVTPLGNNKGTIGKPLGNKKSSSKGQKNSLGNQLGNSKETIREPLGNNQGVDRLSGNELKILNHIFINCHNRGQRTTTKITLSVITETLNISSKNVSKTTLMRLAKKKFITRKGGKRGNGGFATYEIPEDIYQTLILNKVTIGEPLGNNKVSDRVTDRVTSPSSSNSNILNTITTKNEDWLQEIQTPANLKSLGLGLNHIKQLKIKFSLSPEQIQIGLESFAFDLENGELARLKARGIQNIIGYFFGAMKNGGYNSVKEGFISAEELAEQEMIERLEKKKIEREKNKKKLEKLLFEEWLETKTEKELTEIQEPVLKFMDTIHRAALEGHFIDNEFDKFQKELR